MQNPILKFKLYYFREAGLFVCKTENFDELQLQLTLIFFDEIWHTFPTYQCQQKDVWVVFIFFRSLVIDKRSFCECVETRSFLIWQITQVLNKIKKTLNTLLHLRPSQNLLKHHKEVRK